MALEIRAAVVKDDDLYIFSRLIETIKIYV